MKFTFFCALLLSYSAFRIPHSAFCQSEIRNPQSAIPSPSPEAAKDAEWDAGVGFTTYGAEVKGGCWYPVWVEVRALRAPVQGVATISQSQNPLRVEIPIDVAKGSRKIYRAAFLIQAPPSPATQSELNFQLTAQPLGNDSIPVTLRMARREDRHILVLCDTAGSFNFLNRDERRSRSGRTGSASIFGRQSVLYSRPDLVPEDSILLQSIDGMIIDTPQVRRLTPAQWAAMRSWVAQGGQLLLATGRQQPFIQESPLRNPFGAVPAPPEPAGWNDILSSTLTLDWNLATSTTETVLAAWPEPPPGGWDEVRIGRMDRPFLAAKRCGRGWFHYCAAALDPPVIATINSPVFNYFELLPTEQAAPPSPLAELIGGGERELGVTLQSGFAVSLAGVRWVLIYLLIYNLIAMPLNWIFCRWIKHPHLFWPILLVFAAGFAWFGYTSGIERQQRNFQVNELTLISQSAPGAPARALSLTTLFTPRRLSGDMPANGRVYLSRLALADREQLEPLTIGFDPVAGLRGAIIYPWSVINLRGQFTADEGRGIELNRPLTLQGSEFNDPGPLVITNRTKHRFETWWIVRDTVFWAGKAPLDPGTSQTLAIIHPEAAATARGLLWQGVQETFAPQSQMADPPALRSGSAADRDTLYFLGSARGIASPFATAYLSQRTLGRILYEQPLPAAASGDKPKIWAPGLWTARVVSIGGKPLESNEEAELNPGNGSVRFPLNTVIIEFLPRTRLQPGQIPFDPEFGFLMLNYPDAGAVWRDASLVYRMETCPMEVYNFKNRNWEPLRYGATYRFTPLIDYLHPMRSSIMLRLNAEPDLVTYTGFRSVGGTFAKRMTGRELFTASFGAQLPMDVEDIYKVPPPPPAQWAGGPSPYPPGQEPAHHPPVAAQLASIRIRIPNPAAPGLMTINFDGGLQP